MELSESQKSSVYNFFGTERVKIIIIIIIIKIIIIITVIIVIIIKLKKKNIRNLLTLQVNHFSGSFNKSRTFFWFFTENLSSIIGEVNRTVFFFTKHILNLKTHKTITSN